MAETKIQPQVNINPAEMSAGGSRPARPSVAQEQIKYANLLLYGSWAGIAVLAVTFALYVSGIVPSYIHPSQMDLYWGMRASAYVEAAKVPTGWGWLKMVGYGDFLSLVGMAWLGVLTVIGYLILFPAYLRKKDSIYAAIVAVEVAVLTLAASGLLGAGGH